MAKVATGTPPGICAMERRLSRPLSALVCTGTPSTGSGVIEAVGERVNGWKPGDRVMALLSGMGHATKVAVHERMLMPVPANLTMAEAASIPEVFLTAYDALFLQCELTLGESVLVHAAGSGVGTAAVQLAHAASCRTFGTAGSAEKIEQARALGLDVGINYHEEDFAEVVQRETGGAGVHVILDVIGAPRAWDVVGGGGADAGACPHEPRQRPRRRRGARWRA